MDGDRDVEITVLAKGDAFLYTVPSFPVFKGMLLQLEESDGEVKVFDGFARQCDMLDKPLPAVAKIAFSYDNAFIIKVTLNIKYLIFVWYRAYYVTI